MSASLRPWAWLVLVVGVVGCRAGGCIAASIGDVVGATGDAACDRRFVSAGKSPAPFCQELIDTLAAGRFEEDCRDRHGARTFDGRCPRERVIGGCKVSKVNDDGSEVWDWYYDVSDIVADAGGDAGFEAPPRSKLEVQALCADRSRYEEGATYQDP